MDNYKNISVGKACKELKVSRPTLRQWIKELSIKTQKHENQVVISSNDFVQLQSKSQKKKTHRTVNESFTSQIETLNESSNESLNKTFNTSFNTSPKTSEIKENQQTESSNFYENLLLTELRERISELKDELKESREETKIDRKKVEDLSREIGQWQEKADTYKQKYIETQKLLQAPVETPQVKTNKKIIPKKVIVWISVVLFLIAFIAFIINNNYIFTNLLNLL